MKKFLAFATILTTIFLIKIVSTFTINELVIKEYQNNNYNTNLIKPLYVLNFYQPYIAYYNHGNLFYKSENYQEAEKKYQEALKKNPPSSKVCDIEINLSLSKIKQIDFSDLENAKSSLKEARNVLYEHHCADEKDDSGKSKEAEELEEQIKELEKQMGGSSEEQSPNEKEPQEEEENGNEKEQEIEEKLKENRQEANGSRQDKLNHYEDHEYYYGTIW